MYVFKGYLVRWLSDKFIFVFIFRIVCDEIIIVGILLLIFFF